MKLSIETGVYFAFNAYFATCNIMLASQTFVSGFAVGVLAGFCHSVYVKTQMADHSDKSIKKCVKQLNPTPGAFGTFVAFVATKVNEYALTGYLPFHAISLCAGVPLGYTAGKALALVPLQFNDKFKNALTAAKF